MTQAFLLEYIPKKMQKLGRGQQYELRCLTLMVGPKEAQVLEAFNQWLYFPSDLLPNGIEVCSNWGCCRNKAKDIASQIYEHTGQVSIQNRKNSPVYLQAWLVVPSQENHLEYGSKGGKHAH